MEKIERLSIAHARKKNCHAVICGHTHHAAAFEDREIPYYNSGCWTEKQTATYLTISQGKVKLCHWAASESTSSSDLPMQVLHQTAM